MNELFVTRTRGPQYLARVPDAAEMSTQTKLSLGITAVVLVSASAYFWMRLDDGHEASTRARPEAALRAARPELKSVEAPTQPRIAPDSPSTPAAVPNRLLLPGPSTPVSVDVARVLKLRDSEATKARQLLRDEQEAIRRMMLEQHRSFIGPADVEPIRSETDQRFAQLLDKPTFDEYVDYRHYEIEYDRIDRLDRELASNGGPGLSQSQRDSLLAALKEEKNVMLAPQASGYSTQTEFQNATRAWREELERRLQERTTRILSSDQIVRLNAE